MARNGESTTQPRRDDSSASIEVKSVYGLESRLPLVELTAGEASVRIAAEKAPALWIVLIGHGTFDGRVAKFNVPGPDFTDEELAEGLARLHAALSDFAAG